MLFTFFCNIVIVISIKKIKKKVVNTILFCGKELLFRTGAFDLIRGSFPKTAHTFCQRLQGDISRCIRCTPTHAASMLKSGSRFALHSRDIGFYYVSFAYAFSTKRHYQFDEFAVRGNMSSGASKKNLSCKVCVVRQPDAGLPFSRVFLEARFSAVTSQRSERLPRTSHIVQSYLASHRTQR